MKTYNLEINKPLFTITASGTNLKEILGDATAWVLNDAENEESIPLADEHIELIEAWWVENGQGEPYLDPDNKYQSFVDSQND